MRADVLTSINVLVENRRVAVHVIWTNENHRKLYQSDQSMNRHCKRHFHVSLRKTTEKNRKHLLRRLKDKILEIYNSAQQRTWPTTSKFHNCRRTFVPGAIQFFWAIFQLRALLTNRTVFRTIF